MSLNVVMEGDQDGLSEGTSVVTLIEGVCEGELDEISEGLSE